MEICEKLTPPNFLLERRYRTPPRQRFHSDEVAYNEQNMSPWTRDYNGNATWPRLGAHARGLGPASNWSAAIPQP